MQNVCFINRNIHPKVKQITEWLNNYEESDFDFGEDGDIIALDNDARMNCFDSIIFNVF